MRELNYTTQFERDYKREKKNSIHKELDLDLSTIIDQLAADKPLAKKYSDHSLKGIYADSRECHIKSDLLLIYRKPDIKIIELVRQGTHSELF